MEFKTKKGRRYSERFKSAVIIEYLSGLTSKESLRRKYQLGSVTISRWLASSGFSAGVELIDLPLGKEQEEKMTEEISEKGEGTLREEVEELKRRLRQSELERKAAELRAEALEKVIEIAERDLGLDVRKKSVAKQLPK